jgi:hypothetical protein
LVTRTSGPGLVWRRRRLAKVKDSTDPIGKRRLRDLMIEQDCILVIKHDSFGIDLGDRKSRVRIPISVPKKARLFRALRGGGGSPRRVVSGRQAGQGRPDLRP